MVPESDKRRIIERLARIESDETVRILYACESGSRAWGFESRDSDFDVRFIYVRPPGWYLSIRKRRDVIEAMIEDDLDVLRVGSGQSVAPLSEIEPAPF